MDNHSNRTAVRAEEYIREWRGKGYGADMETLARIAYCGGSRASLVPA